MIAIAQLDPASLALWYTPDLLHFGGATEDASLAAVAALDGNVVDAAQTIARASAGPARVRAAHLASVVWHEHRHFADLLLTNYGAYRVRQYLLTYANMGHVFAEVRRANTPLFCPITAYLDPVEREAYGLPTLPHAVEPMARQLAQGAAMLADERRVMTARFGPQEFGGDAQLEALAYYFQYRAVGALFGDALSRDVQYDLPARQQANETYRWAVRLALTQGVAPGEPRPDGTIEVTDFTLMSAILLGSLAVRRWGQSQTVDGERHSGWAWTRLNGLLRVLRGQGRKPVAPADAWETVNAAAKKLWGRTVLEELRADYAHEAAGIAQVSAGVPRRVWVAFHETRGQLLALLESAPELFIAPEPYAFELLPRLRPLTVLAVPHGQLDTPPAGYDRVIGYRHPTPHPEGEWWWAAVHEVKPEPSAFALADREASVEVVEFWAPTAKLLMAGRAHHLALGPELINAEQRLRTMGVELRFHPSFRWPNASPDISYLFDLRGTAEVLCDWCRRPVVSPAGALISPWELRKRSDRADIAVTALGGGETGYLRFLRDWSPWVACEEHARMFA